MEQKGGCMNSEIGPIICILAVANMCLSALSLFGDRRVRADPSLLRWTLCGFTGVFSIATLFVCILYDSDSDRFWIKLLYWQFMAFPLYIWRFNEFAKEK